MSNCWFCGAKLIWQQDYTYEDYGAHGKEDDGTVAVMMCSNPQCRTLVECYHEYFLENEDEK